MSKCYQTELLEALRDPHEAAEYLNAAIEEAEPQIFVLALKNVMEAQGGFTQVAEKIDFNAENLSQILSEIEHSELHLLEVLHALGFYLVIQTKANVKSLSSN